MENVDRRGPASQERDWGRFWTWLGLLAGCLAVWGGAVWLGVDWLLH